MTTISNAYVVPLILTQATLVQTPSSLPVYVSVTPGADADTDPDVPKPGAAVVAVLTRAQPNVPLNLVVAPSTADLDVSVAGRVVQRRSGLANDAKHCPHHRVP